MLRTIKKVFFVWEFEKEEKWLNEMSALGLQLCGVGFCTYHFDEAAPGEYVYRLEMLDNWPTHVKSLSYIRFLEDTGVEHVGSLLRWVYFRRKASDGGFDIYSDISSRISHLNRMLLLLGAVSAISLASALNMLHSWLQSGVSSVFIIFSACFAAFLLVGYGFVRICLRKRTLKREKVLRE